MHGIYYKVTVKTGQNNTLDLFRSSWQLCVHPSPERSCQEGRSRSWQTSLGRTRPETLWTTCWCCQQTICPAEKCIRLELWQSSFRFLHQFPASSDLGLTWLDRDWSSTRRSSTWSRCRGYRNRHWNSFIRKLGFIEVNFYVNSEFVLLKDQTVTTITKELLTTVRQINSHLFYRSKCTSKYRGFNKKHLENILVKTKTVLSYYLLTV